MHDERDIDAFLAKILAWAESVPDVLALALVGSFARGEALPTSDLDLILISWDPPSLIREPVWAQQFGAVARMRVEDWGRVTSLRVWYRDSLEVEFGITRPNWCALPLDDGTRRVLSEGFRVLLDKEDLFGKLTSKRPT
jgi:predicted nucleotidyltransferase